MQCMCVVIIHSVMRKIEKNDKYVEIKQYAPEQPMDQRRTYLEEVETRHT